MGTTEGEKEGARRGGGAENRMTARRLKCCVRTEIEAGRMRMDEEKGDCNRLGDRRRRVRVRSGRDVGDTGRTRTLFTTSS